MRIAYGVQPYSRQRKISVQRIAFTAGRFRAAQDFASIVGIVGLVSWVINLGKIYRSSLTPRRTYGYYKMQRQG